MHEQVFEPKFKVGDYVQDLLHNKYGKVVKIYYRPYGSYSNWAEVRYDILTLKDYTYNADDSSVYPVQPPKFKAGQIVTVDPSSEHGMVDGITLMEDGNYIYTVKYAGGKTMETKGSYMAEVMKKESTLAKTLKFLGFEEGKKYNYYNEDGEYYYFSPYTFDGEHLLDRDGDVSDNWYMIIKGYGTFKEVKPFPQKGDTYYYITVNGGVNDSHNDLLSFDLAFKAMGNMFKTKEDALAHKDEIMAKYKEAEELTIE